MSELQPGLVYETSREITRNESALELGSGTLEVFGTPAMAVLVEQACLEMVEGYLEEGQTTVGIHLQLNHIAPTPLGDTIRVKAEVLEVDKQLIHFKALLWDSVELIGEAEHQRVIIQIGRFQKRVDQKASLLSKNSLL